MRCGDVHRRACETLSARRQLSFPCLSIARCWAEASVEPQLLGQPRSASGCLLLGVFLPSCGAPGRIGWAGWRNVFRPARPRKGTWSSPDSKLCKVETPVSRAARSCVLLAPACALPGIQKPRWPSRFSHSGSTIPDVLVTYRACRNTATQTQDHPRPCTFAGRSPMWSAFPRTDRGGGLHNDKSDELAPPCVGVLESSRRRHT